MEWLDVFPQCICIWKWLRVILTFFFCLIHVAFIFIIQLTTPFIQTTNKTTDNIRQHNRYKTHNNENFCWVERKEIEMKGKRMYDVDDDLIDFIIQYLINCLSEGKLALKTKMNGNLRGLKCKWCAQPTATTDRAINNAHKLHVIRNFLCAFHENKTATNAYAIYYLLQLYISLQRANQLKELQNVHIEKSAVVMFHPADNGWHFFFNAILTLNILWWDSICMPPFPLAWQIEWQMIIYRKRLVSII